MSARTPPAAIRAARGVAGLWYMSDPAFVQPYDDSPRGRLAAATLPNHPPTCLVGACSSASKASQCSAVWQRKASWRFASRTGTRTQRAHSPLFSSFSHTAAVRSGVSTCTLDLPRPFLRVCSASLSLNTRPTAGVAVSELLDAFMNCFSRFVVRRPRRDARAVQKTSMMTTDLRLSCHHARLLN